MLDPQPPALAGIEAQEHQQHAQEQEGPAPARPSSLGGGSSLRALVVQLGAATTSPMAASACARPSSLPVFDHHHRHHRQQHHNEHQRHLQEPRREFGEGDKEEDGDELVEIVLDNAEAGEAGEAGGEEDKATCMICYAEDLPPESTFAPPPGHDCVHSFCLVCMAEYLRVRIAEGRADFPCPLINEAGCR